MLYHKTRQKKCGRAKPRKQPNKILRGRVFSLLFSKSVFPKFHELETTCPKFNAAMYSHYVLCILILSTIKYNTKH